MRPAAGEIDLALEVLDAVDLRRFWRGEAAGGHDVVAAGNACAIFCREPPAFRGLVPIRRRDLGAKADVAPQIVSVGDEAEIAQDFRLRGVFLRPLPRALQFGIERVAVIDGLNVAARAGIAVPVPGAADVAGLLDHHRREAGLAQAMQEIEAGKSGADHGDIDLLRRAAVGRLEERAATAASGMLFLPCVLYFGTGYCRVPGLSSGQMQSLDVSCRCKMPRLQIHDLEFLRVKQRLTRDVVRSGRLSNS